MTHTRKVGRENSLNKYLLYIDILGFSDLVRTNPSKIDKIYKVINSLNVHRHHAFKTIVFSDTILVYNLDEPRNAHDHRYLVMFAIEFAQDLWFRTVGQEVFFRGILRYGPFDHYDLSNITAFYGNALIDSYIKEKDLSCCGLFIDKSCHMYNDIFPTVRYDEDISFVYFNQSLERLKTNTDNYLDALSVLDSTEDYWSILWDLRYLRDIYRLMMNHKDARVRGKYLTTWHFYRLRYRNVLDALEISDFSPKVICSEFDWTEMVKTFAEQTESWVD